MKSITSFIGWVLLAVILAVPAFLFYNWWMNKKNDQMKENTVTSNPASIPFEEEEEDFPEMAKKFDSTAPSLGQELPPNLNLDANEKTNLQETASQSSPADTQIPQKLMEKAEDIKISSPIAQPQAASTTTIVTGNQPQGDFQERQGSYFEPKSDRDPTMSPTEYAQIKRQIAEKAARERRRLLESRKKRRKSSIQSKLKLQGVVGNNVIINGEMYAVGSYVKGAKIIKIGSNYFIGYYKGKKFKKVMR